MWETLAQAEKRYAELTQSLSESAVLADPAKLRAIGKERAQLEPVVAAVAEYRKLESRIADDEAAERSGDPELGELARAELPELRAALETLRLRLQQLLLARDPNEERDVVLEIRAGTGGEEAALFAGDMFRMYQRYAERQGWKVEVLSSSPSDLGGFKEIVAAVEGEGAYAKLKFESGVHRVQRVPVTESQGRIHTSTVTVAVLAEVEDVDIQIPESDIRTDVYRSAGAGGQNVQ